MFFFCFSGVAVLYVAGKVFDDLPYLLCSCYCRYFRFCITQILDKLLKAEFERGQQKSLGVEKKKRKSKNRKRKTAEYERTVDEELQEKMDTAKEYLVAKNRNWGKMSAMMLAASTHDRQIISHDLCSKIIRKVWRNGKIRQKASSLSILIIS